MNYYGIVKAMIPWHDTEGMRQWSVLTFNGDAIDRRRIRREVRRFIQHNFNVQMSKRALLTIPIVHSYDPRNKITLSAHQEQGIEAWIKRLETDETEDGTDQVSAGSTTEGTARPLSDLPS